MDPRFVRLAFVGTAFTLALAACGSDSSSGDRGNDSWSSGHLQTYKPLPSGYDESQCGNFCPDSGNAAVFANLGVEKPVTSDLFGKRYNRATLEAILEASIAETQKYAQQDGIYLFKIPMPAGDKKFPLQYALDAPPKQLRDIWDQTASGNSENSYLDGLFVSMGGRRAIMVREDAGRWTLVHEMMHANFARQRGLDGTPNANSVQLKIQNLTTQIKYDVDQFQQTSDAKILAAAADLASTLPDLEILALGQGSLEEVAVESLLGEEFRAKRLKFVNPSALYSSKFYIESNINQATPDIQQTEDALSALKDKVFAAGLQDSATDLAKAIASCEQLKARLAELLDNAKKTSDEVNGPSTSRREMTIAGSIQILNPIDDAKLRAAAAANARAAANDPAQRAYHDGLNKLKQALQK